MKITGHNWSISIPAPCLRTLAYGAVMVACLFAGMGAACVCVYAVAVVDEKVTS